MNLPPGVGTGALHKLSRWAIGFILFGHLGIVFPIFIICGYFTSPEWMRECLMHEIKHSNSAMYPFYSEEEDNNPFVNRSSSATNLCLKYTPKPVSYAGSDTTDIVNGIINDVIGAENSNRYATNFYPNLRFYLPLILIRFQYYLIFLLSVLPVLIMAWKAGESTARKKMRIAQKQLNNRFFWYVAWLASISSCSVVYAVIPIPCSAITVLPFAVIASIYLVYLVRAEGIEM